MSERAHDTSTPSERTNEENGRKDTFTQRQNDRKGRELKKRDTHPEAEIVQPTRQKKTHRNERKGIQRTNDVREDILIHSP